MPFSWCEEPWGAVVFVLHMVIQNWVFSKGMQGSTFDAFEHQTDMRGRVAEKRFADQLELKPLVK